MQVKYIQKSNAYSICYRSIWFHQTGKHCSFLDFGRVQLKFGHESGLTHNCYGTGGKYIKIKYLIRCVCQHILLQEMTGFFGKCLHFAMFWTLNTPWSNDGLPQNVLWSFSMGYRKTDITTIGNMQHIVLVTSNLILLKILTNVIIQVQSSMQLAL